MFLFIKLNDYFYTYLLRIYKNITIILNNHFNTLYFL